MQRKFLTNLGLLLFLNLLVKPFWVLGVDRSVQNVVGAQDYGFYFAILNFSFLFNILLDLGITNFNNRNIAQNNQLLNKHFSSILIIRFILAGLYILVTFGIGLAIGYNSSQFYMLGWVGLNQFLLSFVLYLRSNISGLLLFKTDSMLSVLDRLLMILFCGLLLWGNVTEAKFKIEWLVYSQTLAYGITAFVALLIVIKKASFKKLNWNFPFLVMILKKSAPFALLVLLMMSYNRIDSVLIERILPGDAGNQQSGVYAQAYRLLDAGNNIALLFAVLLLPIFAKMIKLKQSVEKVVKLSFTILFTISITVAIGSYFYSDEIMRLLYPKHLAESLSDFQLRIDQSAFIFSMLMFAFVAISSTYIFGTLLTANGNLKTLNIVAASGMLISIVVNFVLVPELKAVGSAWAALSSQFITAIAQVFIAYHIFKFRLNIKYLIVLGLYVIGVLLINYFSKQIPNPWIYNFLIMVGASIGLAMMLRLLSIKEFVAIVKSEKA
jgi:O-antigen/teichoic acid export membrane protein